MTSAAKVFYTFVNSGTVGRNLDALMSISEVEPHQKYVVWVQPCFYL